MNSIQSIFSLIQQNPVFLILFSLYTAVLKGLALWKAARNTHKYWFIGLLIINLFGIPEILYLLIFSKKHFSLPLKLLKKGKFQK